jgi:hypothetical protein
MFDLSRSIRRLRSLSQGPSREVTNMIASAIAYDIDPNRRELFEEYARN